MINVSFFTEVNHRGPREGYEVSLSSEGYGGSIGTPSLGRNRELARAECLASAHMCAPWVRLSWVRVIRGCCSATRGSHGTWDFLR